MPVHRFTPDNVQLAVAELEENGQIIKSVSVDQSGTVLVHSEPKDDKSERAKKAGTDETRPA